MTRPSRGERLSATTTRHTGSFFPPTRVSLMLTAMLGEQVSEACRTRRAGSRSALAHQGAEVRHLPLRQAPHQLAHLPELLDELVDLLDARPRAPGDAQAAGALDRLGMAA